MNFWTRNRAPVREDYSSEEEYADAMANYEDAEYWAIESARERQFE